MMDSPDMQVEEKIQFDNNMVDKMNNTQKETESDWIDSDDDDDSQNQEDDSYNAIITEDDDEDDEDADKSFLLPRETMKRIVREITEKVVGQSMRISAEAFEIIRETVTGQLVEVFRMCNRCVEHAGRNTIMSQDFTILFSLIRDLYGPRHLLLRRDSIEDTTTRRTRNSTGRIKKIPLLPLFLSSHEKKKKSPITTTTTTKKASPKIKKTAVTTKRKKVTNRKKVDDTINNEMDVEQPVEKHESKKRKLEQLDRIEEESRKREKQQQAEEDEEKNRMKKREKREEIKRKSQLMQQESRALIQQFENDSSLNEMPIYEFEHT